MTTSGPWNEVSVAATFDAVRAASIANAARFRGVNANLSPSMPNASHPYELARLQWALSGNWNGDGQLVAVVDDGFRISHQEFSNTNITIFGNIAVAAGSSHGTHVAALVAGSDSVGTMMGFAPGADLHLTSYLNDTTRNSIDLTKMAAATLASGNLGAVAQNNSWGVLTSDSGTLRELTVKDVRDRMTSTGESLSQSYASLAGDTAPRWQNYFNALDDFQSDGVIVWAMSNNAGLAVNDASSALPLLAPQLAEAWIAVGNGEFSVNSGYEIVDARRLSSACGEMARWCLFADGTTVSASASSDTNYNAGTGTSFAAPQVSGAIAILAQAFPSLTPEEWTKRLLASAYSNFDDFSSDGVRNFGNGVQKAFSNEWGMGVLDIAAALSPINGISLVNGRELSTASHSDVTASIIRTGTASGDATRALFADVDIAVFDALATPFMVPASLFSTTAEPVISRSRALPQIGPGALAHSLAANGAGNSHFESSIEGAAYALEFSAVDGASLVARSLGAGSRTVSSSAIGTLADETMAVVGSLDTGLITLEHYGFAGAHATIREGSMIGFGGGASIDLETATLKVAVLQSSEQGGMLGMRGEGYFSLPTAASLTSLNLSGEINILPHATVFGGIERGLANGRIGDGYVDTLDALAYSSFQFGLRVDGLLSSNDSLSLSVSQPLRVDGGDITLSVPAGRTLDGDIINQQHTGSLAPSGRQLDLGLNYRFTPDKRTTIELGAVYSHDLGHVEGSAGAAFAVDFHRRF